MFTLRTKQCISKPVFKAPRMTRELLVKIQFRSFLPLLVLWRNFAFIGNFPRTPVICAVDNLLGEPFVSTQCSIGFFEYFQIFRKFDRDSERVMKHKAMGTL